MQYIGKKVRLKVSRGVEYAKGEIGTVTGVNPCDGKYGWEVTLTPVPNPDYDPDNKMIDCGPLGIFEKEPVIHRVRFFYTHEVEFI
jgi:hypothetical protein